MTAIPLAPASTDTGAGDLSSPRSLPPFAALPVIGVLAVKVIGTMMTAGSYGFQRDELYYLACARHLDWGYVDFPALVPALARLDTFLFGAAPATLRLFSILAGAGVILLAALVARELGGAAKAQTLAAFATLLTPLLLGANVLFQTVSFDQLCWATALFVTVRLLRTGDARLWPLLGVAFGVGLETKYTVLALAAGLFFGFLLSPQRRVLLSPGPGIATLVALLILFPNLLWQVQHGWISLTYIQQHSGDTGTRLQFVAETLLLLGPIGLPLAVLGIPDLFSRPALRPVAWAAVLTPLLLLAANGKSYYAGPIYPLLIAAGSVRAVRLFTGHRIPFAIALTVLTGISALLVPLALPVLAPREAVQKGIISARKDYADMFGWQGIAGQVARAYQSLSPRERRRAAIVTTNYGEAGAVDLYGHRYGLPHAVSGDLTYALWKPPHLSGSVIVAVGFPTQFMSRYYRSVTLSSRIRMPYGVQNEERGAPILVCREPRASFGTFFAHIRGWG